MVCGVAKVVQDKMLLNEAGMSGLRFAVFIPAWLTTAPAKKFYCHFLDITALDYGALLLRNAKMTIRWEDVAEEILRVAAISKQERVRWFGYGVHSVDMKLRAI